MRRSRACGYMLPLVVVVLVGMTSVALGADSPHGSQDSPPDPGVDIDSLSTDNQSPNAAASGDNGSAPDFLNTNTENACEPFLDKPDDFLWEDNGVHITEGTFRFVRSGLYRAIYRAEIKAKKFVVFDGDTSSIVDSPRKVILQRYRFCNPVESTRRYLLKQCAMQAKLGAAVPFGVMESFGWADASPQPENKYESAFRCFRTPRRNFRDDREAACTKSCPQGPLEEESSECMRKCIAGPPRPKEDYCSEAENKENPALCPEYCYCMRQYMRGMLFDGLPTVGLPEWDPYPVTHSEDKDWLETKQVGQFASTLRYKFQYISPNHQLLPELYYLWSSVAPMKTDDGVSARSPANHREVVGLSFTEEAQNALGTAHSKVKSVASVLRGSGRWGSPATKRHELLQHVMLQLSTDAADKGGAVGHEDEEPVGPKPLVGKESAPTIVDSRKELGEKMQVWEDSVGDGFKVDLTSRVPASFKNAKDTFRRILTILHVLHKGRGIMHGNIKPGTVLLSPLRFYDKSVNIDFDQPRTRVVNLPKLDDFGSFTRVKTTPGCSTCKNCKLLGYAFYESSTPDYSPPELLLTAFMGGRDIFVLPHQVDVFGAAVMLWEYLTATNMNTFLKEGFTELEGDEDGNINYFSSGWMMQKLGQMILATDPVVFEPLFHTLRDIKFMTHQGRLERDGYKGRELLKTSHADPSRPGRESLYGWHSEFERMNRIQALDFIRDCISAPLKFERCDEQEDTENLCDISVPLQDTRPLPKDDKRPRVCCKTTADSGCGSAWKYLNKFTFFDRERPYWH